MWKDQVACTTMEEHAGILGLALHTSHLCYKDVGTAVKQVKHKFWLGAAKHKRQLAHPPQLYTANINRNLDSLSLTAI